MSRVTLLPASLKSSPRHSARAVANRCCVCGDAWTSGIAIRDGADVGIDVAGAVVAGFVEVVGIVDVAGLSTVDVIGLDVVVVEAAGAIGAAETAGVAGATGVAGADAGAGVIAGAVVVVGAAGSTRSTRWVCASSFATSVVGAESLVSGSLTDGSFADGLLAG